MTNKQHWESIYKNNAPKNLSWYQTKPTLSLQLIEHCSLSKNQAIIDIGGGASCLVDHLLQQGYQQLSVLDISDHALQYSQKRLGDKAKMVHWHEENITRFIPPFDYNLWHDRAVFHFLREKADRQHYIETLHSVIKKQSFVIIAAFPIGGVEKCSGLDIVQYNAKTLSAELGDDFILVEQLTEQHLTPSNNTQDFQYFRFKRV
ncbi:MAG: class I SAM-dependent methyltransferase [Thiotrichaceae bacterium]|nr:class I SAM-dependent methyltransferase [Thiotrichaceae bacterium]